MNKGPFITITAAIAVGIITFLINRGQNREDSAVDVMKSARETSAPSDQPSFFSSLIDSRTPAQVRVESLRQLDKQALSSNDIDCLYNLLAHQPADGSEEDWWFIVNEIMEQLRSKDVAIDRYAPSLLSLINDDAHSYVLRDYAVQHLGLYCIPTGEASPAPYLSDPQVLADVTQAFADLIVDDSLGETSVPGTTLNLLVNMQQGGVDPSLIQSAVSGLQPWIASTIEGRNQVATVNRVSAINVTGELGLTNFTPTVRALAQQSEGDATIKLNAIAALGLLGDDQDLASLTTLANSSSKFRHAAKSALKNLTKN